MPDLLQEYCSSRGLTLRIDRAAGLLRGVKLLGLTSKNGREYPEATLARAARLYDGAKVNVNHPKGHPLAPRDYQDRIGTIHNVAARPAEGHFGDLQFNPKHALAEQLLWDAEHAPENVGFSHNVQARTAKRGDTTIVEEILSVQSVDLVADPATTRGLFESAARDAEAHEPCEKAPGSAGGSSVDLASTNHSNPPAEPGASMDVSPNLFEHLCREQSAEIQRLRAEIDQLQAAQAIAQKRAAIAALLVEHGLPPFGTGDSGAEAITSDSFVQSLFAAPNAPAMRALVRERAALVEQSRRWTTDSAARTNLPLSREQSLIESHRDNSLDAFLKAIRS